MSTLNVDAFFSRTWISLLYFGVYRLFLRRERERENMDQSMFPLGLNRTQCSVGVCIFSITSEVPNTSGSQKYSPLQMGHGEQKESVYHLH